MILFFVSFPQQSHLRISQDRCRQYRSWCLNCLQEQKSLLPVVTPISRRVILTDSLRIRRNKGPLYISLVWSHWDLHDYLDNIRRKEKKRYKFSTWMWKRVKVLWKVLNPREGLFSSRADTDDEILSRWSEDKEPYFDNADKKTESDGSPWCSFREPLKLFLWFHDMKWGH